jgi:hypothetical protein
MVSLLATSAIADQRKKVKIGSGDVFGSYYSISLSLCRYISNSNPDIDCEVIPTESSVQNINLLKKGLIDFAILQSNLALDAYNGVGYFLNDEPFNNMYQLLNLHDEIFTVMVRDDSNILVFKDLEGKKISNGPPESDSTVTYKAVEAFYDFKRLPINIELNFENYARELCDKRIDAIMMMTGHPSALANFVANNCDTEFISIDEAVVDEVIKKHPSFHKKLLKAGFYPQVDRDQHTISVPAIFVSTNRADPKIIGNLLNALEDNINNLKLSHSVLYDMEDTNFKNNFVLPTFSDTKSE